MLEGFYFYSCGDCKDTFSAIFKVMNETKCKQCGLSNRIVNDPKNGEILYICDNCISIIKLDVRDIDATELFGCPDGLIPSQYIIRPDGKVKLD